MTRDEFKKLTRSKIVVLDGAMGTELQKLGMPNGVCVEKWVLENPHNLINVQKNYKEAGSDVVYSCTFGGNRFKLAEFGFEKEVYEINKRLAELSREAVGSDCLIAGDIAPTGKFIEPFGDITFEDAINAYKEQAKALFDGGVDFFVVETMIDIQEMRAAIIGIKEISDLPILASLTFSKEGFTLTGSNPVSALITLQSLGADAVGCNCSTGPQDMLGIINLMKPYAKVPLIAKPNAGLPKVVDGKTVFDMSAADFAKYIPQLLDAGVNLIGGCCGTSNEYIKEVSKIAKVYKPIIPKIDSITALSSSRKTVFPQIGAPLKIVGERINPTGKKKLQDELRESKLDEVKRFAFEQKEKGAAILDVNMGMGGIDEKEMMIEAVKTLSGMTDLPLCIDSSDPKVIEAALRVYPGRALINSISNEKKKISELLPIAAKYGAMFILLPLDDEKIPDTAEGRVKIIESVYKEAEKYNFTKNDIVVDGLVMTVSSDQNAARETLKLIKWCSEDFGVNTIVGLSNVSFGLPQRKNVNAAFLSMAMSNGLSMAIANPSDELLMNMKYAADVLTGNDAGSKQYIDFFAEIKDMPKESLSNKKPEELVFDSVLNGDKENIVDYVKMVLKNGFEPSEIVDGYLIKAINKVGELYEEKKYFLPQLIASAEAMKAAFVHIEPLLMKKNGNNNDKKKIVVLATVKGDIHDIGKNIVALMIKNYGFDVIDLGKDVDADRIIEAAKIHDADIIGLSALMTTTMIEMKSVINKVRQEKVRAKVIVGGAVITKQYADEINSDGFAKDGIEAVKLIKVLLNIK